MNTTHESAKIECTMVDPVTRTIYARVYPLDESNCLIATNKILRSKSLSRKANSSHIQQLPIDCHMQRFDLPADLPVPVDDGACSHLKPGTPFPVDTLVKLPSTSQRSVDITSQPRTIIYFYPRTGKPNQKLPDGWDDIPGARGCTPESCGFRDHYQELQELGANVYGCSTQTTDYQQEVAERLNLPFDILSDAKLELLHQLNLPHFTLAELDNMPLIKRVTIVLHHGVIEHVFYPIFPPDQHCQEVINWLKEHPLSNSNEREIPSSL